MEAIEEGGSVSNGIEEGEVEGKSEWRREIGVGEEEEEVEARGVGERCGWR